MFEHLFVFMFTCFHHDSSSLPGRPVWMLPATWWFMISVQPPKSDVGQQLCLLRGGLCIFNIFLHHSQSLPTCCTSIPSFLIQCPICYSSLYLQKLKWFDLIVAIWSHLNRPHQIKIKLSWSISFPSADIRPSTLSDHSKVSSLKALVNDWSEPKGVVMVIAEIYYDSFLFYTQDDPGKPRAYYLHAVGAGVELSQLWCSCRIRISLVKKKGKKWWFERSYAVSHTRKWETALSSCGYRGRVGAFKAMTWSVSLERWGEVDTRWEDENRCHMSNLKIDVKSMTANETRAVWRHSGNTQITYPQLRAHHESYK